MWGSSLGIGTNFDFATVKYAQAFPSALIISTDEIDNGYVGMPYAKTLWAFGGSGTRQWQLAETAPLPPGLELNSSTGIISGTPTTPGTYDFTAYVLDGELTASKSLSITVHNPMISGRVTRTVHLTSGDVIVPIQNLVLNFSGGAGTATTDSNGDYIKPLSLGWSGTVVPSTAVGFYYNYSPSYRVHAAVTDPLGSQDFDAFYPMHVFFNNQPGSTQVNQPISPALLIAVLDDSTAPVPGVTVTVALGANPGGATLSGGGVYTTGTDGTITVSNLSISAVGRGYTIIATGGGRTVSTVPFDVH